MYSLKCKYYDRKFSTIEELINDVMMSGMDPNYEVTYDGEGTNEIIVDLITF